MSKTEIKHDPELPYAFVGSTGNVSARFAMRDLAIRYGREIQVGSVIDTTPKPKIPEDAEFILVDTEDTFRDIYCKLADPSEDAGYYWFRTADRMSYGADEIDDLIGDAEVTVLVRKGKS